MPRTDPLPGRFHRLLTAAAASNLGDGLVLVGTPLLALELTRDPALIGGVQVAFTLPWLLVALQAGALADRVDRRHLLIAAALLRAAVLVVVGVATLVGFLPLWLLYLAVFVVGIGEVVFDSTTQSAVPDVVGRDLLGAANGRLVGAQVVMNNFVGAPLAGLLVGIAAASIWLGPAALYLLAAVVLLRLRGSYRAPTRAAARMRDDVAEGVRYLRDHRTLRAIGLLGCVLNLGNSAYFGIFVLFVVGDEAPMGLPEVGYGLLATGVAAGSVVGSLLAARVEAAIGPRRMLLGSSLAISSLMLVPVVTAAVPPIALMALVIGVFSVLCNVASVSSRQRIVPSELLGRVNAAFRLLSHGAQPLGALAGGLLASAAGLRVAFVAAVAVQLLALAAFQRPITDDVLRGAPPATDDEPHLADATSTAASPPSAPTHPSTADIR